MDLGIDDRALARRRDGRLRRGVVHALRRQRQAHAERTVEEVAERDSICGTSLSGEGGYQLLHPPGRSATITVLLHRRGAIIHNRSRQRPRYAWGQTLQVRCTPRTAQCPLRSEATELLRRSETSLRANSGREQAFLLHVLSYMRELPSKRADSS